MPAGDCEFRWSAVAISLLTDLEPSETEFEAIRATVCQLAAAPELGAKFFFDSSPIPFRQYPVGRFLLIYRLRGVIEIAAVQPRPPL